MLPCEIGESHLFANQRTGDCFTLATLHFRDCERWSTVYFLMLSLQ